MKKSGKNKDDVQDILAKCGPYFDTESNVKEGFDLILTNEDLQSTFRSFEDHIYSTQEENLANGQVGDGDEAIADEAAAADADAPMADAPSDAPPAGEPAQDQEAEVKGKADQSEEVKEAAS